VSEAISSSHWSEKDYHRSRNEVVSRESSVASNNNKPLFTAMFNIESSPVVAQKIDSLGVSSESQKVPRNAFPNASGFSDYE